MVSSGRVLQLPNCCGINILTKDQFYLSEMPFSGYFRVRLVIIIVRRSNRNAIRMADFSNIINPELF